MERELGNAMEIVQYRRGAIAESEKNRRRVVA